MRMKKLFYYSTIFSLLSAANAYAVPNRVYVGTDFIYDFNKVDGGPSFSNINPPVSQSVEAPDSMVNAAINAGYNFSENFGVEVFYQASGTHDKTYDNIASLNSQLSAETSYQAYGLDMMAYIKSTDKVDWLLSAGVAQYNFETEFKYSAGGIEKKVTEKDDSIGLRLGAGFQINFDDYISFRAMYRYIFADIPGIDKMQEILVGVRIGFDPFYY